MKTKTIILVSLFFFLNCQLKAQVRTVEANGKKISFEVTSNKPEGSPKFYIGVDLANIFISNTGSSMPGLELTFSSKYFKTSANLSLTNYRVQAIIAPFHTYKTRSKRLPLLNDKSFLYVTEEKVVVRNSYGLHFGFNQLEYSASNFSLDTLGTNSSGYYSIPEGLKTKEIFVGMAFINTKNIKAVVILDNPRIRGVVNEFSLYADVILFNYEKTNILDPLSSIGFRSYFDYYYGYHLKNMNIGFLVKIGAQYGPIVNNVMPILNFGVRVGL